jgi:hypothetical protein
MIPYYLDIYISNNTEYTMEEDRAYIVRAIGTNSTSDAQVYVDGRPLTIFDADLAPLNLTTSNFNGPFNLKELYIVIPPKKKFKVIGSPESVTRLIGTMLMLDTNEVLPAEYAQRYAEQFNHFWTKVYGSVTLGTDVKWKADQELKVISLLPLTSEKYILNNLIMGRVTGGTISRGQVGVYHKWRDTPYSMHSYSAGPQGIDILSMPYPPSATTELYAFYLDEYPIEVPGDIRVDIVAKNVSGSDLTPTSGQSWKVEINLMSEYFKLERG